MKILTALPVFNESRHVTRVLNEVRRFANAILVVDDGSTDATPELLARRDDVCVIRHATNRGYGAALRTAFSYALEQQYDAVITIDCDHQHEPGYIPQFVEAIAGTDIVSGSRYLQQFDEASAPPEDRWRINRTITSELNRTLDLKLTDAFCGFKAYRTSALARLTLRESGYAMPLELWVAAVAAGLRIQELAVPLIYLDERRSFGGDLDQADARLKHYREVIHVSCDRFAKGLGKSDSALKLRSPTGNAAVQYGHEHEHHAPVSGRHVPGVP